VRECERVGESGRERERKGERERERGESEKGRERVEGWSYANMKT